MVSVCHPPHKQNFAAICDSYHQSCRFLILGLSLLIIFCDNKSGRQSESRCDACLAIKRLLRTADALNRVRRYKMYDSLIWWLVIMTPCVLLTTCLILTMERRGSEGLSHTGQSHYGMICGRTAEMTVITIEPTRVPQRQI